MPLKYDGLITIAVGGSRRSASWKNKELLWSELAEKLRAVTRTQETQAEYIRMPKEDRDNTKDVGGFVGGTLKGGRRKLDAVVQRRLLTLDLDSIAAGEDPWPTVTLLLCCAAALYSTHSHTKKAPRLRLVIPLSRPVTPEEYEAIARRVAGDIGIDMCDDTTYEPHRLMYWPSASCDAEFRFELQDAPWLDADEVLARYADWQDPTQWPVSGRKAGAVRRMADKQGDPTAKEGIVGAFCRVYSVEDAIETFLQDIYKKGDGGRYTYSGGTTTGGLVIYEDGKFAYSHHSTDPACGKLCNAFDLVRIHLFGKDDEGKPPNIAAVNLPSYKNMVKWIETDLDAVMKELQSRQLDYIVQLFGEDNEDIDMGWVAKLEVNPKTGRAAATVENIRLIVQNDPRFKGAFYFDEFMERPMVCGDLPWRKAGAKPRSWDDTDDAGVHNILEKDYKIDSMPKTREGIDLALLDVSRHPVREYLRGLVWDGAARMETLFVDYLGAEDSKYTRAVTRKALIGAAARILMPGCKHDHMLVLVGPQGSYKSTTLKKLGKDWFSDSLYTMGGKEAYEQLQGNWIIELSEMAAARKAEVEQIKQFVSKQEDNYRAAYARRTQCHPRQCAFFGTTNDEEFLRDPTGARRFWPIVVTEAGKTLGAGLTEAVVDQIWAEAVACYDAGETWYLDGETEALARKVQADHTETSGKLGRIEKFLNTPLPEGWEDWDLDRRLLFWDGGFGEEPAGTVPRTKVCALEIWQELYKGGLKEYSQQQAREIINLLRLLPEWRFSTSVDCGPLYGRQRGFRKR